MNNKLNNTGMTCFEAAKTFYNNFIDKMEAFDMPHAIGLIPFDSKPVLQHSISPDFDTISLNLGRLEVKGENTFIYSALDFAVDTIENYVKENSNNLSVNLKKYIKY
ncbi:hypothetical protein ABK040_000922 [Willaertia magna]